MKPKAVYLFLCVVGTILPYSQFVPWLAENGFHLRFFVQQLFANRIGAFFGLDVILSAVVLLRFIRLERKRLPVPHPWLPVVAVLTVGVSFGLPLFLYLREVALEQQGVEPRQVV